MSENAVELDRLGARRRISSKTDVVTTGGSERTATPVFCGGALLGPSSGDRCFPSDDDLVARTRAGDAAALPQLLARHAEKLLRLALRIVRNEHDAQEVLQEVAVTVWLKLPGFAGRAQFSTWIHRVTINAALTLLRTRDRIPNPRVLDGNPVSHAKPHELAGFESFRRAAHTPHDQLQLAELQYKLGKAIDELPPALRTVFHARLVEGRSTLQTAVSLGLSTIAVKTRLHRARAVLRANIADYGA